MQTEKMRAFILHVLYWCIIAGLIYVCAKYLLPALSLIHIFWRYLNQHVDVVRAHLRFDDLDPFPIT